MLPRDYNHHPFGQHQITDTLRAYTRLVLQLLLLLLRAQDDLDLPAEVYARVTTLHQTLDQGVEEAVLAIHQLLLALWMREWTPTAGNLFPDPTVRLVIHTQVNADGSLKKPEDVTGVFAKLVYDMVSSLSICLICADFVAAPNIPVRVPPAPLHPCRPHPCRVCTGPA